MGGLLSLVAQQVFRPLQLCFVYFSLFVRWSLGYMAKSGGSIEDKAMGEKQSRSRYPSKSMDFDAECDSTWEDEGGEEVLSSETSSSYIVCNNSVFTYNVFNSGYSSAQRKKYAAEDMQKFRHGFRDVQCDDTADDEMLKQMYAEESQEFPNLLFYHNQIKSRPDGVYIDEFHSDWFGDYERLEWVHSYIQWLFPIQEKGMNYDAPVLTPEEIKLFRKDKEAKRRLLESYKLMLDFYGIKLLDEETGEVCCAVNWKERFRNLNRNTHNNLRITRILKCLGILGLEHYQAPLVRFFLKETLVNRELPNVKRSVLDYFMFAVLDTSKRKELIRYAFENFKPEKDFVWCPLRIQKRFKKEITSRKPGTPDTHPSESSAKSKETDLQTERESQTGSSNNVAETGDANGNSANSPPDHKNEPKTEPSLDPSDVTTGNEKASDSDKVNEESSNEMPGSNTTEGAFGDSAESPPFQNKQDCDNNADDLSVVKKDIEVHEDTVQSGHAPGAVSSDLPNTEPVSDEYKGNEQIVREHQDQQTSHGHPASITEAVDEIQKKDLGGCNHTAQLCSTKTDEEMFEVSKEEETVTGEQEPKISNIPPGAVGDSGESFPIQKKLDCDNIAVDVKNDTEVNEHTQQSGQAPVSVSSDLANQKPVSDGNKRNVCEDQETSDHQDSSVCNHTEPGNKNVSAGDTQEKPSEVSHDEEKRQSKKSPAIENSGSADHMDVDPPGSVTSDVDMCDMSNGQDSDSLSDRKEDDDAAEKINAGDEGEKMLM